MILYEMETGEMSPEKSIWSNGRVSPRRVITTIEMLAFYMGCSVKDLVMDREEIWRVKK